MGGRLQPPDASTAAGTWPRPVVVVVLVHGIPTSPQLWRHVIARLGGVRVLAFEMVGYGQSIPAGREHPISVADQARYLNRWRDHLAVDRAVLVGHDLGGGVVQIAAVDRPDRCGGLVLTNAIAYDSWPIPSVRALRAAPRVLRAAPDAVLKLIMGTCWPVVTTTGRSRGSPSRSTIGPTRSTTARPLSPDRSPRSTSPMAVAHHLVTLDVPTRVVWGLADQFQKPHYGERLARDLDASAVGIRGGKHFTPEDHPDVVAAAVTGLVHQIDQSRLSADAGQGPGTVAGARPRRPEELRGLAQRDGY